MIVETYAEILIRELADPDPIKVRLRDLFDLRRIALAAFTSPSKIHRKGIKSQLRRYRDKLIEAISTGFEGPVATATHVNGPKRPRSATG